MSSALTSLLAATPVLPVVVIEDAERAVPLAQALLRGGVGAIEVTLRTPVALDAIRAITRAVPKMQVGVGTVRSQRDLEASAAAGAKFAVSPGATPALLNAARASSIPLLPGVATTSEIMQALELGYSLFKFFPAASSGGVDALKAFGGPFSDIRFCPTGGINARNAAEYLALKNVICVGGSWLAPEAALKHQDWAQIENLAAEAVRTLGPLLRR